MHRSPTRTTSPMPAALRCRPPPPATGSPRSGAAADGRAFAPASGCIPARRWSAMSVRASASTTPWSARWRTRRHGWRASTRPTAPRSWRVATSPAPRPTASCGATSTASWRPVRPSSTRSTNRWARSTAPLGTPSCWRNGRPAAPPMARAASRPHLPASAPPRRSGPTTGRAACSSSAARRSCATARPGTGTAPGTSTGSDRSEARPQSSAEDVYRPAHGVVGGIVEELVVGGHDEPLAELESVVGFDDVLRGVAERAVADQDAEPAGCQIVGVVRRDLVHDAGNAHAIVRPAPRRALDRQAEQQAGVDVGEGTDLAAAVIPAEAPEQADTVGDLLFEVEVEAVFGTALAGLRDGVVVGTGEGAGEPRAEPHRAGPVVGTEAQLQFGGIAAACEQVHVEDV